MPFSAQDALKKARASIEDVRNARGSKFTIIRRYRTAKRALDKVDNVDTDTASLREIIVAFKDLAEVLHQSGEKERAEKCIQRSDALRQKLDGRMRIYAATITPSLIGPGFSTAIAQAGAAHWRLSTSSSSATSTVTVISTSTGTVASTASSFQQPTLRSPRASMSISVSSASQLFFYKDVNLMCVTCTLPGPDEPLQTTRQLAYCLALLHDSVGEDDLSPDTLKWRRSTSNDADAQVRLEATSAQIIEAFSKDVMKDAATVAEVVQLAPVLDGEHSRFLLKTFIDTVNQSEMLHLHSLEGLAKAVQGAAPGSIDSDDLVAILRSLHRKLGSTHSTSHHSHDLLLTVSRVLDAMTDANIGDVDRVDLHEPLTDFLRESESSDNPYMAFQAAYATQALLHVSDDEKIWHAGFRRVWLALKGCAGFAKMPSPTEIKEVLENLERLYEAGKGGARVCKEVWEAFKYRERPTFTVKEGLKFKRAWYRAVRMAETYIQAGKLMQFEDLITTAPCRHQVMFQWGICQLLGQFAADTQWALDSRQNALALLGALYKSNGIWRRQKEIDQVIFDALTNVTSKEKYLEAAKALLKEMEGQNPTLKPIADQQSPLWNNVRSAYPTGRALPKLTLLKAVQDKNLRHAKLETLPNLAVLSLDDVHSALKAYHAPDLSILRVSGQKLDLETCFVNLAIVEAPEHREEEKRELQEQAAVFHRIPSFEKVKNTNTQSLIPLEQLFDKRMLRDGKESVPKRILVQGRAGIGKTTLCKKLVHSHQSGLWKDLFDTVLWIPLRQLRGFKRNTLEGLFREKIFAAQNRDQHQAALAETLLLRAEKGKVLFILDGLDEIMTDTEDDESKTFRSFLKALLEQQHVIITSRPSGLDNTLLPPFDLELETVGFSQKNVKDFLVRVLEPEAARRVHEFIQQTPLIQGLVNIPVQLDVICFSWDSLPRDGTAITMTALYQLMVWKLWCKDALRLQKTAGGKALTERQLSKSKPKEIIGLMAIELQHLGYLAFKGMGNNHQIEFDEDVLLCAFEDLEDEAGDNSRLLPSQLVEVMKQTSFLHTADADLDPKVNSRQAWHFLHLTFQEYFAATWIVRHLQPKQKSSSAGMMSMEEVTAFIHRHKYNPQYEIVWSMVAGLLEGKPLREFFGLLQGAPRDLIGGRHQQVLAACLNEARARLDREVVADLDLELVNWLHFEMQTCQQHYRHRSLLGSQISFPEASLVETLGSVDTWRPTLIRTLEARSSLSGPAVQFLVTALKAEDGDIRSLVVSALGNQSTLPGPAIQCLTDALKDSDWRIRCSVATALGNQYTLPETAIQSLTNALKDKDADVRFSAASALGNQSTIPESAIKYLVATLGGGGKRRRSLLESILGNQSTLPTSAIHSLTAALKDKDKDVRSSAALILSKQSALPESVIQPLIAALRDDEERVRSFAESALSKQPSLPESAIQTLIAELEDVGLNSTSLAASVLDKQDTIPESAIQSVLAALRDKDERVRSKAEWFLRKQSTLPESAIQSLVDALKDKDMAIWSSAASVLGKQSALPESAIKPLVEALKDGVDDIRSTAASTLGKKNSLPESAIQSLIAAFKDNYWGVRSSAASALGNQCTLHESAVRSLINALKDDFSVVRSSAALALGKQSTLPESAIQFFLAALKDEDNEVRSLAASILEKQTGIPEWAIQPLIASLKDTDERVRSSVVSALSKRSILPGSAIKSLIAALKDYDRGTRSAAACVLGGKTTLPESAIRSLTIALSDKHWRVRSSAALALGNQSILSESATRCLFAAFKDKDRNVRSSVSSAFGKKFTVPVSVIQHFIATLRSRDPDMRSSAAWVLSQQNTLPESAIKALIAALKDNNESVRSAASETLREQCQSLCMSFPHLTEDEMTCLYEKHLFRYSCSHVMSLQVQDGKFYFYTEQGVMSVDPIGNSKEEMVTPAFTAVQHKAGLL